MMISNIFCLLFSFSLFSPQDTLQKSSTIREVTLYEKGAVVTRNLDAGLLSETTYISVRDLPVGIDPETLQVQSDEGIEILSVQSERYERIVDNNSAHIIIAKNRLQGIEDSLNLYNTYIVVLSDEKKLIKTNNKFSSADSGVDIAMLKEAAELYRNRLKQIEVEIFDLKKEIRDLHKKKNSIEKSINSSSLKECIQGTEVILLVRPTNANLSKEIDLSYYINNAGWKPYYDLRVEDSETYLKLDQKAYVYQKTGEEWNNVKLSITNSSPEENKIRPSLKTYYFDKYTNMAYYELPNDHEMSTVILSTSGEPLIGANVIIKGTSIGTTTDINGRFYLPGAIGKRVIVSYAGFTTKEVFYDANTQFVELEEGQLLDEVVVTGNRNQSSLYYIDGVRPAKEKRKTRTVVGTKKSEGTTAINYTLDDLYTIPNTGKTYEVFIERKEIIAEYHYQVFPRISAKAYLIASITEWEQYDLMSAPLNIYHNSTYKGKSILNAKAINDTLEISVGIDPEVVVKREEMKDFTKKSFFKNKIIEEVAWEISLRNTKRNSIVVQVLDQVPVSQDKSIKVELIEHDDAKLDKERGFLDWRIELAQGDRQTKRIIYKVKYEKDRKLIMI